MIYHFLTGLLIVPVVVVGVLFALSNQHTVILSFSPLDLSMSAPLYLIVLVAEFGSFLLGGAIMWLQGMRTQWALRKARHRLKALEAERETWHQQKRTLRDEKGST